MTVCNLKLLLVNMIGPEGLLVSQVARECQQLPVTSKQYPSLQGIKELRLRWSRRSPTLSTFTSANLSCHKIRIAVGRKARALQFKAPWLAQVHEKHPRLPNEVMAPIPTTLLTLP
jgi:hypothetical protein